MRKLLGAASLNCAVSYELRRGLRINFDPLGFLHPRRGRRATAAGNRTLDLVHGKTLGEIELLVRSSRNALSSADIHALSSLRRVYLRDCE